MTNNNVLIIGAGWAGATVSEMLHRNGVQSEIFEATDKVGGHSRSETINGVVFEYKIYDDLDKPWSFTFIDKECINGVI